MLVDYCMLYPWEVYVRSSNCHCPSWLMQQQHLPTASNNILPAYAYETLYPNDDTFTHLLLLLIPHETDILY